MSNILNDALSNTGLRFNLSGSPFLLVQAKALGNSNSTAEADKRIKNTDLEAVKYNERLAEAKKKQNNQGIQTKKWPSAESAAKAIGKQLAATTGTQFMIFGENHFETNQYKIAAEILRAFQNIRKRGDKRPIIFFFESEPHLLENNSGLSGSVGEEFAKLALYSSSTEYKKEQNNSFVAVPDFLNYISSFLNIRKVTGIDVNKGINYKDSENLGTIVDRDTAMSRELEILSKENPKAVFIGFLGGAHTKKFQRNDAINYINTEGVNLNDPAAEQIALLKKNKHVITILATTNSKEDDVGKFDHIIQLAASRAEDWVNPWKPSN